MTQRPLEGRDIVLADDHGLVRMGLRLLLEGAGASVVAEAATGEAAIEACIAHRHDALVMDVSMPGIGGLAALDRLHAHLPDTRVLMLSAHDDIQIPARALRAGAYGYLSKRAPPEELIRAVGRIASGKRYLGPQLASRLALAQVDGVCHPADSLTDRELIVFLELARGQSAAQVAGTHNVSPSTVGTHLYHIKQKLNAGNAAELALIAVRAGFIEV